MGCFLACFGISKKRKRRKPTNKVVADDQRNGSYVPLDSSVFVNLDSTENPINSDSELSNKSKERLSTKIRKKVRFNLNVQTYEPISTNYHFLEGDEEEEKEKSGKETPNGSLFPSLSEGDSTAYPSNYRYRNCTDRYDEEDEIAFEESDLDDDDEDGDCDVHFQNTSQEEFSGQYCTSSIESQKGVFLTEWAEDNTNDLMTIRASTDTELKSLGSNRNARDRSQYVQSVLNPVENLTQWKAVKSRAAPTKHRRKENIVFEQEALMPFSSKSKPPKQEIAVDASLSNWLFSPNSTLSETTTINRSSTTIAVKNMSSKEIMLGRSTSWRNRENKEITQLEAC